MQLDTTDIAILNILQKDSKTTTKEISHALKLSVTAIYERIKKLERQRIITHYSALLDKKKVGKNFGVFCHIKLARHTKEFVSEFEKQVLQFPEVQECFHVSGDYDYILKVNVKDMEAYRLFLINKLTTLNGIGSTQSTFVVSELKNSTVIDL